MRLLVPRKQDAGPGLPEFGQGPTFWESSQKYLLRSRTPLIDLAREGLIDLPLIIADEP